MGIEMSQRQMNRLISHLPGVIKAVSDQAHTVADIARAKLAEHRHDGHSTVTVTHGEVDAFVNLDDSRGVKAAAAIEYGHVTKEGKHVPGLYVLTDAAGLERRLPHKAR
ncbi:MULTISPECIES: DUF5403 family protein [Nocardia]|uniref:DUF5403 family protein n=1 Tax=Nocardia iowensis TaxID=204891 RepID=A0ABX8RUJ6_NOCIO|nr:DUF5403 family protein [Nocardia iowensis]QXN92567.1 DUF5403 family protein [Nocardia iowensis]